MTDVLGRWTSLGTYLADLHQHMVGELGALSRIAVAVYDESTDHLRTFIASPEDGNPLTHYEVILAEVPSLKRLAETGESRVIDDIPKTFGGDRTHTRLLIERGYRSSYTVPIHHHGRFFGFIFYDSTEQAYFTPPRLFYLDLHTRLISLLVVHELAMAETLGGVIKTVQEVGEIRDKETAAHLSRMSQFCYLIAVGLADSHGLSDEFIEYLFLVAPLHDIGKLGTPDDILMKNGPLTEREWRLMRTHVDDGGRIVEAIIRNFDLEVGQHTEVLRNVVLYHHEAMDGSGYPFGLAGEDIPIEARITSVADVFDALTSERPYKEAWPVDKALAYLREHAGSKYDPACIAVLERNLPAVEGIRQRFPEDPVA